MALIFCFLTFRYVLHFSSSLIAIAVSGALLLHKTRRTTTVGGNSSTILCLFAENSTCLVARHVHALHRENSFTRCSIARFTPSKRRRYLTRSEKIFARFPSETASSAASSPILLAIKSAGKNAVHCSLRWCSRLKTSIRSTGGGRASFTIMKANRPRYNRPWTCYTRLPPFETIGHETTRLSAVSIARHAAFNFPRILSSFHWSAKTANGRLEQALSAASRAQNVIVRCDHRSRTTSNDAFRSIVS